MVLNSELTEKVMFGTVRNIFVLIGGFTLLGFKLLMTGGIPEVLVGTNIKSTKLAIPPALVPFPSNTVIHAVPTNQSSYDLLGRQFRLGVRFNY